MAGGVNSKIAFMSCVLLILIVVKYFTRKGSQPTPEPSSFDKTPVTETSDLAESAKDELLVTFFDKRFLDATANGANHT